MKNATRNNRQLGVARTQSPINNLPSKNLPPARCNLRSALSLLLLCLLCSLNISAQTWTPKTEPPFDGGVDGMFAFTIGDKIYIGAPPGSNEFFQYDPATDDWAQKADIPVEGGGYRAFGIGFSVNGKGYIGLGANATDNLNDMWQYDPATDAWTQLNYFPGMARTTANTFVIGSKAYVLGGVTENNFYTNQLWEYDPATDTWTHRKNPPCNGMAFPFTFSVNGKGYFMGGEVGGMESQHTYEYNPATDNWMQKADFPGAARQAGISFVIGSTAYCGLGMAAYDTMFGDLYKYDPAADTWTSAGNFTGGPRAWCVAATYGSKAYIGTGWDFNTSFYNDWWESSFTTGISNIAQAEPLRCYPNPAKGSLHLGISPETARNATVQLINTAGILVYERELKGQTYISTEQLPAGIYTVHLHDGQQHYTGTIVLQE